MTIAHSNGTSISWIRANASFHGECLYLSRRQLMNFLRSDSNLRRCMCHCLISIDDRRGNSRSRAQVPSYIILGLLCLARPIPGLIAPRVSYIISAKLRASATPQAAIPFFTLAGRTFLSREVNIWTQLRCVNKQYYGRYQCPIEGCCACKG